MANDITAINLNAYFKLHAEEFQKGIEQVQGSLNSAVDTIERNKQKIREIGMAFTMIGGAITAAFTGVALSAASFADDMDEMSQRTGVSASELSGLKYAADQTGTSIDGLEGALKRGAKNLYEAANGSKAARETFNSLGIEWKNQDGTLRTVTDLMRDFADKTAGVEDPTVKAALAQKIFGKAGAELLPMFIDGREGLEKYIESAKKYGLTITDAAAKSGGEFKDALDTLGAAFGGIGRTIGLTVLPAITPFVLKLTELFGLVTQFFKDHPDLTTGLTAIAFILGVLTTTVGTLLLASTGLPALVAVVGTATTAFAGLAVTLGVSTGGLTFILAGIGLAIFGIIKYWDELGAAFKAGYDMTISPVMDSLVSGFNQVRFVFSWLVDFFLQGWDTVYQFIRGIFGLPNGSAWQVIFGMLEAVYNKFRWVLDKLGVELPEIKDLFSDIKVIGEGAANGVSDKWDEFKTRFGVNMDEAKKKHAETEDEKKKKSGETTDQIIGDEEEKKNKARADEEVEFGQFVINMLGDEKEKKDAAWLTEYERKEQDKKNDIAREKAKQDEIENEFALSVGEMIIEEDKQKEIQRAKEREAVEWHWGSMIKNMANQFTFAASSGGVLWGGLQALKETFKNAFAGLAIDFQEEFIKKISGSVSSALSGFGKDIAELAGNITGLGVIAVGSTIVNKLIGAATPDYEKARTGREWQNAFNGGEKIFTVSGARNRLSESEFAWNEESLASLKYDISNLYSKYGSKDKADIKTRLSWQAMEEQFNVGTMNALAGFGLQELEKAVSTDPAWIEKHWGTSGFTARMLADFGKQYSSQAAGLPHFASGGYIDSSKLIFAHTGEGVLNKKAMDSIGGQSGLNRINSGGGSGDIYVNITGNNINSELDIRSLARAAADEILKKVKLQERLSYQW